MTKPLSTLITNYFLTVKSTLSTNSLRYKELTKGLLNFVVKNARPFLIFEGNGFREFMKIAVLEYKVPCSNTITKFCDSAAVNGKTKS